MVNRWCEDVAAACFHLDRPDGPHAVVLLGGTGTGKSTLLNRLLGAEVSATSYRRTYTSGPIAVTQAPLPASWGGLAHQPINADLLPCSGQSEKIMIAQHDAQFLDHRFLVDTPDVDGDTEGHHRSADRCFRWAETIIFVVTPEKYQMTELLAYYRLANRYGVPAVFVLNKCESNEVVADYRQQLTARDWASPSIFVIPRDDAAYEPDESMGLRALQAFLLKTPESISAPGHAQRCLDLVGRLRDQIVAPWRAARKHIDQLAKAIRTLQSPEPGVDVSPVTDELRQKMQSQSVLYLMGPRRILDRVRQVPTAVSRMPRAIWDLVVRGEDVTLSDRLPAVEERPLPNFHDLLSEQFSIFQSRLDTQVRAHLEPDSGIDLDATDYKTIFFKSEDAGRIATEELAALKQWLGEKWDAKPRDTRLLERFLRALPGGEKIIAYTEAAPWLLVIVLALQGMAFSGLDWVIIGGYSLATWITEKLSNEVTNRTRETNHLIQKRFQKLADAQTAAMIDWLESRVPDLQQINKLERLMDDLQEACQ